MRETRLSSLIGGKIFWFSHTYVTHLAMHFKCIYYCSEWRSLYIKIEWQYWWCTVTPGGLSLSLMCGINTILVGYLQKLVGHSPVIAQYNCSERLGQLGEKRTHDPFPCLALFLYPLAVINMFCCPQSCPHSSQTRISNIASINRNQNNQLQQGQDRRRKRSTTSCDFYPMQTFWGELIQWFAGQTRLLLTI